MHISAHTMRTIAMPLGMVVGVVFARQIDILDSLCAHMLTPILIFVMLFTTFCRVDVRRMHLSPMHAWLLMVQFAGSIAIYYAMLPLGEVLAQGAMICMLAPIAMAAVVIGGMLGANLETMVSYSLVCNIATALLAPTILSLTGSGECTLSQIVSRVAPLLIAPFVVGQLCRIACHKVVDWVDAHSRISFYVWLVSLAIVMGRTTMFILNHGTNDLWTEFSLATIALVICIIQFALGRRIGARYGDRVAGGQSLGQKNTVLAVWMAQTFLNPLSCIAPTAYIVWQNIVNSYQIYRKKEA